LCDDTNAFGWTFEESVMGLLDQILTGALGQQQSGTGQGNIMQLVLQLINNYPGGLQGLLQALTQSGLGQQAQSWVSTGNNLPVSPEQIKAALGGGHLESLARQLGMTQDQAAGGLANVLPQVVDHLTPNGAVQNDLIEQGLSLLRGKLMG
jgi:uncharacterized protein YidB (DUF937 family)